MPCPAAHERARVLKGRVRECKPGRHCLFLVWPFSSRSRAGASLALSDRVALVQHLRADCIISPDQAQKIGLLVNEIVMNAIKHAHPTGIPVQIAIGCRRRPDGRFTIEVADDGIGLPDGGKAHVGRGVGFRLIKSLAQSLNAELVIESDALCLAFQVTLPPALHVIAKD